MVRTARQTQWIAIGCLLLGLTQSVMAQDDGPLEVPLWPGGAPGALGDQEKDVPTLICYRPTAANNQGAAIVICPGGGYGGLAMGHEGHEMAAFFRELGMTAVILSYRHRGRGYGHPAPRQDVQQALRWTRSKAEPWKFAKDKIGIIGFSAGGHLASTAATQFDLGNQQAEEAVARESCRPDFAILCYPVIAWNQPYTHRGSQRNLLGPDPAIELVESMSSERRVTRQTPPIFLWHTNQDKVVPVENSLAFYQACRQQGVPVELHLFEKGRHGLGLARNTAGASAWPELCRRWLVGLGVIAQP